MTHDDPLNLDVDDKAVVVPKLQRWFERELDQEIGRFDAEFLLDFLAAELGPAFYNRGLRDARAVLELRAEELGEAIYALERSAGGS